MTVSAIAGAAERLASRVAALRGWKRATAAWIAGAISVLAHAPFHATPVLFATLAVLVWLIDGTSVPAGRGLEDQTGAKSGASGASGVRASAKPGAGRLRAVWRTHSSFQAARVGWWFGFGYFVIGLAWIGEAFLVEADKFAWLLPFAVTLLPAALAAFHGVAIAAARQFWRSGLARVLTLAIAIGLAEWLRGHLFTGFPWNLLGYALTAPLALAQSAAVLGVYALTPLVVVVFAAPLACFAQPDHARAETGSGGKASRWTGAGLAAGLLAALWGYGAVRLADAPSRFVADVKLRIVQPSIAQHEKWVPQFQRANFDRHLDLSRRNAAGRVDDLAGVTHLVWPEAAMPFLPLQRPEALAEIGALLPPRTLLMSGALRLEASAPARANEPLRETAARDDPGRRAYNSLMVFGFGGGLAGLYDKIHLVPFGEYLPFQGVLEAIGLRQLTQMRGGFTSGRSPRPLLTVAGLPPVGALVCYEAIFPDAIVGDGRPGVLVNVTNDGWFGHSIGPWQHLQQAQIRAVEQGLPLVRSANNGISAVIDPYGRILSRLDLDVRGVIDIGLPQALEPTVFAQHGRWMLPAVLAALAGLLALCWKKTRRLH